MTPKHLPWRRSLQYRGNGTTAWSYPGEPSSTRVTVILANSEGKDFAVTTSICDGALLVWPPVPLRQCEDNCPTANPCICWRQRSHTTSRNHRVTRAGYLGSIEVG